MRSMVYGAMTVFGAALMLALSVGGAGAQAVRAGPVDLDLTGRVQVQLNTTSVEASAIVNPPPSTVFETRRVRLGARFAYGDWITGKVEADFARGAARLTDGYVDLAVLDRLGIRAGQFRKPFGVFELESSTKTRTIERGVRIRGLGDLVGVPAETQRLLGGAGYTGRQIGAMAHGAIGGFGYAAGIFNGEGANVRETAATKAYAARATYDVRGPGRLAAAPLVLGAAVSAQPTGLFDGSDEIQGKAVEVDASWGGFRQPGLHVRAEWMLGENPLLAVGPELPTMTGLHGVVAWFAPSAGRVEGYEPVLRAGWADPATAVAGDAGLFVTPGLNLYFAGRNRLMLNGDVYIPERDGLDPELALVAQLQVYF